jgi:outer membrane lipoprotein-sorting protein
MNKPNITSYCSIFLLLLPFFLSAKAAHAVDTEWEVMQRMQSDTAVRIAYQETRILELIDQPWQGSGYLYSQAPDLMIKEQLRPERVLMGIKGDRMFYFDPAANMRHRGELDAANPLSLHIAFFNALVNADIALLHRVYRVDFDAREQDWLMTLKPRRGDRSGLTVVISGPPGQQAERIEIRQADGDHSEFLLSKDAEGKTIETEVNRLYKELLGN